MKATSAWTSRAELWAGATLARGAAVLGLALIAACATGKTPPEDTPMAVFRDPKNAPFLTYLFGMGDQACTIASTGVSQDLGSPEAMVKVRPFALDVHEVTNEQYRFCVEMEICSEPAAYNGPNNIAEYYSTLTLEAVPKYASYPVVYVTQNQAKEYCAFRGKRLPTEFEWELAAGGMVQKREDKLLYTFLPDKKGDTKIPGNCDKSVALAACNGGNADAKAVGASKDDKVVVGGVTIWDLAGNVAEWTSSDGDETRPNGTPISATCDWNSEEQPWTCGKCAECLASKQGGCDCYTCICGKDQEVALPGDPSSTVRPNCYQPNKTPVCPRYPAGTVLDKSAVKNIGSKRVIRGGAYATSTITGLSAAMVSNCFGRSDARVIAKGPQDDPLMFVGFRCAKDAP